MHVRRAPGLPPSPAPSAVASSSPFAGKRGVSALLLRRWLWLGFEHVFKRAEQRFVLVERNLELPAVAARGEFLHGLVGGFGRGRGSRCWRGSSRRSGTRGRRSRRRGSGFRKFRGQRGVARRGHRDIGLFAFLASRELEYLPVEGAERRVIRGRCGRSRRRTHVIEIEA